MRAFVQEARWRPPTRTWCGRRYPSSLAGTPLDVASESPIAHGLGGHRKLPAPRGTKRFRILVAEYERHKVVAVGNLASKVTYLDAIEI